MRAVFIFLIVWVSVVAVWISCSPEHKLERLKRRNPELFYIDSLTLDTLIKREAVKMTLELIKRLDTAALNEEEANEQFAKIQAYLAISELDRQGVKDCDSIIKHLNSVINSKAKKEIIYRDAKCEFKAKSLDTLGVKIDLDSLGNLTIKQKDIEIRKVAKFDVPKCPETKSWFWEFIICLVLAVLFAYLNLRK